MRQLFELWPVSHGGTSQQSEHLQKLVVLIVPTEQGMSKQKLAEDAAHGPTVLTSQQTQPYVEREGVELRTQQELGRTIPERHNVRRHSSQWKAHRTNKTEVGDLQLPVVCI